MDIEQQSFEFPWTKDDFIYCLRQHNCMGMYVHTGCTTDISCVTDTDEVLLGYVIYELCKSRIHVINFAVDKQHKRSGIGSLMVSKLKLKLSSQRRTHLILEVREKNLEAQLFWKANGFRAESVLRSYYDDTTEDAYSMIYRHTARISHVPTNRIGKPSRFVV